MPNLLLEIGAEEIPAGYIQPALEALSNNLQQRMNAVRIGHGDISVFGTPRRLTVFVQSVEPKQKTIRSEVVGPPVSVAYDAQGQPTMAAVKFAEKVGVDVAKLAVKKTTKGDYIFTHKTERGIATRTILTEILPEVILATPFPKTMRWADLDISFARPIHSIVALLGKQVISFNLGNLKSGRYSRGHYFMAPGRIKIDTADDYIETLRKVHVIVDIDERRELLRQDINNVAEHLGGRILPDEELVDINTNLVETPIAGAGKFDEEFLEVPDEVLINAMREHQKYFSVVDAHNKLLPCFIAVNNTRAKDMHLVSQGHERVIRARLADAQFFYRGDLEVSNDDRVEKLKGVLFQAQLGTMHEKTQRVRQLAEYLVSVGYPDGADQPLKDQVVRAAWLCKSDLVSQVVGEFPKLQGIMGRVYAAKSGEHPDIAAAIEEHYRPVYSGAPLPQTTTGAVLSIADKIDSICGCFSVGLVPTGASDPYALRRQGIGIIQIMNSQGFTFSLSALIRTSLNLFGKEGGSESDALVDDIYRFFTNRISHLLVEEGFSKDVVAAVIGVSVDDVPSVWHRVGALESLKAQPDFEQLVAGFKRVANILKKSGGMESVAQTASVDANLFENDTESDLLTACQNVEGKVADAIKKSLYNEALLTIASLRNSVDAFFDGVMVMTENRAVRDNRLALLARIARLFESFADFSKIAT